MNISKDTRITLNLKKGREFIISFFLERDSYDYCFVIFRIELFRKAGLWLYPVVIQIERCSFGLGLMYYKETPRIEEIPF